MKCALSIHENVARQSLDEKEADVRATEDKEKGVVNVPGKREDEKSLNVVPMTSALRACTRAVPSSDANSRLCGAESHPNRRSGG